MCDEKNVKIGKSLEYVTDVYLFLMIVLFPLIVDKTGFFHILECKYRFFISVSSIYLGIILLICLYCLVKKIQVFHCINKTQLIGLIFLGVNILSYLISPFRKTSNLFIGPGRLEGLLTSCLYILIFLSISYFGKFKRQHILLFSISSVMISIIAVLQFIGFNPLNMYQNGIGTHNVSFMTTIGNIDFISAIYTVLITISFTSYLLINNMKGYERILHLSSVFLGSFIFQIINVSSGKVAFMLILIMFLPLIFKDNQRLSKFISLICLIILSTALRMFINVEYHYDIGKIGFYFNFNYMVLLFLIVIIGLVILNIYIKKENYELNNIVQVFKKYYIALLICAFCSLVAVYLIPFKSGFLHETHELMHFNFDDTFGTFRIFLWKRSLPLVTDYPILGSGPDSFVLRFMPLYSADIAKLGEFSINDTAANIYLTMLINLGLVGLVNYLLLLFIQVYQGLKQKSILSFVLLTAIICYMIQSFFNLSVVIVSPIFWILMGIFQCSLYNNDRKNLL